MFFILLVPFFIDILFFILNKLLISVKLVIDSDFQKYIEITTLKIFFVKECYKYPIDRLSYSLTQEKVSRLTKGNVFRIYFDANEIFKRHHELDGLNDNDILNIIDEFNNLEIKEIDCEK